MANQATKLIRQAIRNGKAVVYLRLGRLVDNAPLEPCKPIATGSWNGHACLVYEVTDALRTIVAFKASDSDVDASIDYSRPRSYHFSDGAILDPEHELFKAAE